jgi:hypothetical protein
MICLRISLKPSDATESVEICTNSVLQVRHDDAENSARAQHAKALFKQSASLLRCEVFEHVRMIDSAERAVGEWEALRQIVADDSETSGSEVDVCPTRVEPSSAAKIEVRVLAIHPFHACDISARREFLLLRRRNEETVGKHFS